MRKNRTGQNRLTELRKRAEAGRAPKAMDIPDMSPEEGLELVHELQTHQIELEMQNEELRRTQQELLESRDRYSDLYNFAPVGYVTVGHNGLIIEANLTLTEMLGIERRALVNHPLSAFIIPDDQDVFYRHRRQVLESKQHDTCQMRMLRRDAEPLWAEMDSILVEVDDESNGRFRTAISDITERKRVEDALRAKNEKYRRLFEGVEASIWEEDFSEVGQLLDRLRRDSVDDLRQHLTKNQALAWKLADAVRVIDVNDATLSLFGAFSKEQFLTSLDQILTPSAIDVFIDEFCAIWDGDKTFRTETTLCTLDGRELSVILSLPIPTTKEGFASVPVSIIDITERKQAEEALSVQATHDALTGLINRGEFERRLRRVLDTVRKGHEEHALCYLDLDQFKVINDTCGHMAGDELLRQLGQLLPASLRKRDTLARLGGDEFGLLMEHCTVPQARRVANKVRDAVADFRFVWEESVLRIGVSIGMVPITETSESVSDLLSAADSACYVAKDEGRNRVHIYHLNDTDLAHRQGEMRWVGRIAQALEDERFQLWAQPIVPIMTGSGKGEDFELLLRLVDERGETKLPGVFLPAAERYGLSAKLDCWVIGAALGWLSRNPKLLERLHLCFINLSGASLADEEVLEFVHSQLERTQVPSEKICFEVTETAAMANLSKAMTFMGALKKQGCRFALDDFGSGLSSFAYLKTLPVEYLKIDGGFVKDIAHDKVDLAFVRSINDVGNVMGKMTIAESVENDAILEKLREIKVDYAQGYGIGHPAPIEQYGSAIAIRNSNIGDRPR